MDLHRVCYRLSEDGRYKINLVNHNYYVIFFKGKQGLFSPWKPIGFVSSIGEGKVLIVLCHDETSHAETLSQILEPIDTAKMITVQTMSLDAERSFHQLFPGKGKSIGCCQE